MATSTINNKLKSRLPITKFHLFNLVKPRRFTYILVIQGKIARTTLISWIKTLQMWQIQTRNAHTDIYSLILIVVETGFKLIFLREKVPLLVPSHPSSFNGKTLLLFDLRLLLTVLQFYERSFTPPPFISKKHIFINIYWLKQWFSAFFGDYTHFEKKEENICRISKI